MSEMKNVFKYIIAFFLISIAGTTTSAYAYNNSGAVSYADEWCNGGTSAKGYNAWNNSLTDEDYWYNDYQFAGGDCANFVSQ